VRTYAELREAIRRLNADLANEAMLCDKYRRDSRRYWAEVERLRGLVDIHGIPDQERPPAMDDRPNPEWPSDADFTALEETFREAVA
jgi:hypothetical protein